MFSVWSISDLHLSFGVSNKSMDVFGPKWENHPQKIEKAWKERIQPEDLVLIGGDTSWAKKLSDALPDLEWVDQLPGTKVVIRGNHDYWWPSLTKLQSLPLSTMHFLHNNAFHWNDLAIGGARLWDTNEYNFDDYIDFQEFPMVKKPSKEDEMNKQKIFDRELERLIRSLDQLSQESTFRIVMTHYPPIGPRMQPSKTSQILERYHIDICIFGHLHNVKPSLQFGKRNEVQYYLTSCDYIDFVPIKIIDKSFFKSRSVD